MAKHECSNKEIIDQAREHIKDLPNREARLVRIEEAIKIIKELGKSYGRWAVLASFIGGLLGQLAPGAVNMLTKAAFAQTAGTDTKTVDKAVSIYENLKSITSSSPRG